MTSIATTAPLLAFGAMEIDSSSEEIDMLHHDVDRVVGGATLLLGQSVSEVIERRVDRLPESVEKDLERTTDRKSVV